MAKERSSFQLTIKGLWENGILKKVKEKVDENRQGNETR